MNPNSIGQSKKGLKFQHVCNQDYGDWKWSQGLNKTMGVVIYLSTLGSTLKIIWCESVGRIVSGLIDIDPCSKTAKIHHGNLIGRWVWEGKCNVFKCICVYNIALQCEIFIYIYIYIYKKHWTIWHLFQCVQGYFLMPFTCLFTCIHAYKTSHVYLNAQLCTF